MPDFGLFVFWSLILLIVAALTGYPKIFRWWTGESWILRSRRVQPYSLHAVPKIKREDLPRRHLAIPPNPEKVRQISEARQARIANDPSRGEQAMRRRLGEPDGFTDPEAVMIMPQTPEDRHQVMVHQGETYRAHGVQPLTMPLGKIEG